MNTYTAATSDFEAFQIARISTHYGSSSISGVTFLNGHAKEFVEWDHKNRPTIGDYFIRCKLTGYEFCKSEEFFNKNFKELGDDK